MRKTISKFCFVNNLSSFFMYKIKSLFCFSKTQKSFDLAVIRYRILLISCLTPMALRLATFLADSLISVGCTTHSHASRSDTAFSASILMMEYALLSRRLFAKNEFQKRGNICRNSGMYKLFDQLFDVELLL